MTNMSPAADDVFFTEPVMNQPVGPPMPIMWTAHTPDERRHRLADLDVWVTWVVDHYKLDRRYIPECWTKHWELIEELSALHLAWESAYATTSRADAPLAWHERLGAARLRLADWVARAGCRPGAHRAAG
ncbi:hypothetical protein N866_07795 [Actinotalea ferrariae CF5-4]|uniref:DUF4913 domain-containing protein n=1 Tax=Actinotalea ferrariae CF5-4 TaxID=948458 RepID=A0A021VN45_9CELL|nr:hypothetical protein [Actinotalea ferrariae]EYR62528.1 hypothetical protein N866_07795 [Actinotalea ferrariae CF5-4]